MNDLAKLEAAVTAAKAAYAADPTPANKAVGIEAVRALAAAKKAAAEAGAAERSAALLAKARESQAAREREQRREAEVRSARRAYARAEAWPRCLDGWPATAAERRHNKIILEVGP